MRKNEEWSAGEEEGCVRLTRNGDKNRGRFYTWRGSLHDVNPGTSRRRETYSALQEDSGKVRASRSRG